MKTLYVENLNLQIIVLFLSSLNLTESNGEKKIDDVQSTQSML